jgi:4-hydroxybenzoate polyprenyltransferase
VLGIILGISPYGAWLAARPQFSWIPGFLLIGAASWVAGFDILYSLQDLDFDRESGLKSIPVQFGKQDALGWVALFHSVAVVAWFFAGRTAGLGLIFKIGLTIVTLFLFWEHWLLRRFGLARINQAFFTMNACVSIALFLSAAVDLLAT